MALMACGACPLLQGCINICGQILGAIIGCGFLNALLPPSSGVARNLGANAVPPSSTVGRAFLGACSSLIVEVATVQQQQRDSGGHHNKGWLDL